MRLVWRLVLSHTLLAALLLGGLGLTLISLMRINDMIGQVLDEEVGTIQHEEDLHRAAWAIEVAARHGRVACASGERPATVAKSLRAPLSRLRLLSRQFSGQKLPQPIRRAVMGYAALARRLAAGRTCDLLQSAPVRREQLGLDESLTDAWINRMVELHGSLTKKEQKARRTGTSAVLIGAMIGLLALVAALVVARAMARGVTVPLRALAESARRVGEGDFSPIPSLSGPAEVRDLSQDLDRMRARLAELDTLKQRFLASASHELRTPLTKIREVLALLDDGATGELNPRQERVVRIARQACEKEIRIVTELLDLSRLQAGQPIQRTPGRSFDDVLHRAIAEERSEAQGRGVEFRVNVDGDLPKMSLDVPLLERAIANIIRNAVSVSKEGQVVEVRRSRVVREGGLASVQLLVQDQGPGVRSQSRATLFQAFVTHPVDEHPERLGIGLGLSLAREVARAHGGDVELVDGTSSGATFALWLPLGETS